jgi:hypothetical protein
MSRNFNRDMLSVCIEASLRYQQEQRHEARIDPANPAQVAQAQLEAEGGPTDAAAADPSELA